MRTSEAIANIYLDIETFGGDKPPLEDITPDGRLKDPDKIAADIEKKQDDIWRKQALDSVKGIVLCVGLAVNDEPAICIVGKSEEETLTLFDEELHKYSHPRIIAHNGFEFDFLFLFHRGLKHGLPNLVNKFCGSGSSILVDTFKIMSGPAWKKYVSLDNMSKLLGFDGKGDIDGSMVHDMYLSGKVDQICDYCKSDVEVLRSCYKKLYDYGLC
jgi:predicted PolB exonuclease-like 3'-5' exonuclease